MVVEDVMNINGALFILLTNITFQNVYAVVNVSGCVEKGNDFAFFMALSLCVVAQTFAAEQPMFLREHWNGMYRTDVYMISKMLADAPFHILYSSIFVLIAYYPIGFNPDVNRFLTAVAILVIVANVATSFGNTSINCDK